MGRKLSSCLPDFSSKSADSCKVWFMQRTRPSIPSSKLCRALVCAIIGETKHLRFKRTVWIILVWCNHPLSQRNTNIRKDQTRKWKMREEKRPTKVLSSKENFQDCQAMLIWKTRQERNREAVKKSEGQWSWIMIKILYCKGASMRRRALGRTAMAAHTVVTCSQYCFTLQPLPWQQGTKRWQCWSLMLLLPNYPFH